MVKFSQGIKKFNVMIPFEDKIDYEIDNNLWQT